MPWVGFSLGLDIAICALLSPSRIACSISVCDDPRFLDFSFPVLWRWHRFTTYVAGQRSCVFNLVVLALAQFSEKRKRSGPLVSAASSFLVLITEGQNGPPFLLQPCVGLERELERTRGKSSASSGARLTPSGDCVRRYLCW